MVSVLIVGSGGREHALAWALSRSPQVHQVYVAPGNGGTAWEQFSQDDSDLQPGAPSKNVAIPVDDIAGLLQFAADNTVELTVVGPEVPLSHGIVDAFQDDGLSIFGPAQAAAQIEASKAFAKDFMTEQGIPTGEYFTTDAPAEAHKFLREYQKPVVVKASGLAAGKGVLITDNADDAHQAVDTIMQERAFGTAGDTVIIEERLEGRELSLLAFCDGTTARPMRVARDYKRALNGNNGLNTGGMGAIAPADDITPDQIDHIMQHVIQPVLDGMQALGTPYRGILYAGLMLTDNGLKVLEFNCRFGDPETQVLLPLLKTDLYAVMQACINGTLSNQPLTWHDTYCSTVVCASPGYPESYPKGLPIQGINTVDNAIVFHAGTARDESGQLITSGGRVLSVTALADTLDNALKQSYAGVQRIHFESMHYRTDIGEVYE
jgi:phosphoribosylamine--glycine ligase